MRRLIVAALPAPLRKRLRRLHPDQVIAARGFDQAFYLRNNPDVAAAGADPLEHFMQFGWREGRDPSAEFSVEGYLAAFPEVAESGVNPFVHYLTSGRPVVRRPESPYGFRYEVIEALKPVEERLPPSAAVATAPADALALALRHGRDEGLSRLHVTFSHDDYTAHLGGLQLSVRREAERLAELGRDHLHLYPARAWPVVRAGDEVEPLGVILNGHRVGVFASADVAAAMGQVGGNGAGRSFAIHSLLGHRADEAADILAAADLADGVFWLHDFASLCAGFHLLRDDVEDCAAPPPDSAGCSICVYGPWRARQMAEHARLFERLRLTVAAPSQVTLDLWTRASPLKAAATVVLPHAELIERGPAPAAGEGPFCLAYAGLPVAHKGWPIFRALAVRFAEDPRYEFLHLGARGDATLPVKFQQVGSGMAAALEAVRPDAVLVWPLCRETFSFVAYEAVAAGCAVVTGPDSGNVQAFVTQGDHGQVLDEAALFDAFETGAILGLARGKRRAKLYDLRFGALTLDLPA